jgi:hypothetical protein
VSTDFDALRASSHFSPLSGIFDASGDRFWVSIQHNVTGHGVVLEITGWEALGDAYKRG